MTDSTKPPAGDQTPGAPELNQPGFADVLKALLEAYQPVLEQQLSLAKNPEELQKEAQSQPPTCAGEYAAAEALFGKFLTPDVALKLIPESQRARLGPPENWAWCLEKIRCSIIFGWLVCRGPRTFRAWAYYAYQYWLCVRQALGTPVATPPTADQTNDFRTLIAALAEAYKPYLTDQLASVEFPAGIPDEVIAGQIDCTEGQGDACAIFDRLLTTNAAQALVGQSAFATQSQDPNFWFCQCWCLCSICFGCCLARARNFVDVVWCLVYYFRCLADCFRPLTCAITSPASNSCAVEQPYPSVDLVGVEIKGTAAGAFCNHYILEWRDPVLLTPYTQSYIVYAPPAPAAGPGVCGKVNATLGYLQTYGTPVPTHVEVRLTVYSSESGQAPCVQEVIFNILETRVSIENVAGINVPDWADPTSQLTGVPAAPSPPAPARTLSVGDALEIWGHAWVGGCANKQIKRFTLSYQAGFITDPKSGTWTQFWEVDYNSPLEQATATAPAYMDLTSIWQFVQVCLPLPFPPCPPYPIQYDQLDPSAWYSGVANPCTPGPSAPPAQGPFPIVPELPLGPGNTWSSQTLPPANCYSGQYTLLLTVEDTSGGLYYDTQEVWFDNKSVYGEITGILGVAPCAVINLSQITNAGNCGVVWPLAIEGIAYDEYIIEGNSSYPSDNFGGYCLTVTRQGGSFSGCTPFSESVALPVPNPASPVTVGTNRVGDPGVRCATASPPPSPAPVKSSNVLTVMDARMFDNTCGCMATPAPPAGFGLNRAVPATPGNPGTPGQCCAYIFSLQVWDNTICEFLTGGRHYAAAPCVLLWPVYICNDLPPLPPGTTPPCP